MSAPSVAFELLLEDGTAVALDVAPDALGYHVVRDGAGLERTINAADPWAAVAGVARSMRLPSPLAAIRRRRARLLPRGVRPHGARGGGRDALVRARVDFPLTPNHCCIHPCLRVAEVRAEGATPVPEGYVALGAEALARRLGVHRVTAWRRMERLKAVQRSDPDALRVVELPVAIGSGARRLALHVLWPVSDAA